MAHAILRGSPTSIDSEKKLPGPRLDVSHRVNFEFVWEFRFVDFHHVAFCDDVCVHIALQLEESSREAHPQGSQRGAGAWRT